MRRSFGSSFFFFNDTATTEIYTLSLHDALPISSGSGRSGRTMKLRVLGRAPELRSTLTQPTSSTRRSEEHTSELQSQSNLVCRLLLEKKKNKTNRSDLAPREKTRSTTTLPHRGP